jgi:hypothetical protein
MNFRIDVWSSTGLNTAFASMNGEITKAGTRTPTRLLREWHGVTHEVIMLEDGVQYRGETWASLSAVAREITGTRWSGPLFFGLKGRRDDRR